MICPSVSKYNGYYFTDTRLNELYGHVTIVDSAMISNYLSFYQCVWIHYTKYSAIYASVEPVGGRHSLQRALGEHYFFFQGKVNLPTLPISVLENDFGLS